MDIVYFEVNNWFSERDYPKCEPFLTWMKDDDKIPFRNAQWINENKINVAWGFVDMSQNFCVTAPKEWVEKNCPELLTDWTKFLRYPDEFGYVYGRFDQEFIPYDEDYIGILREDEIDW